MGGTENWDRVAGTKWAITSGGDGGISVPTSSDNVVIESGNVTVTVSLDIGSLTHTGGILNTNNQTITAVNGFTTGGTTSRTLSLGTSIINCESFAYSGSGLILNIGTSIIISTGNFSGNGETYYEVRLNGNNATIYGNNYFTTLKRTNISIGTLNDTLILADTQHISGTFTIVSDSATNRIFVESNIAGVTRYIEASSFSINYAAFKDISLVGSGSPVTPISAQNLGNNNGINFPSPVRYWVGGTGNWSDGSTHWSLTSGGTPGQTAPGITDNVFFDAQSN